MTVPVPSTSATTSPTETEGLAPGDAGALGDLTAAPAGAGPLVAEVGEPTPAPTQAPGGDFETWEVSPGLLGFLPVFLIALACVGLFLSLTRHMRRVTVRQALRDAEEAAASGPVPDGTAGPDGAAGPAGTAGGGRSAGDGTRPGDRAPGPR